MTFRAAFVRLAVAAVLCAAAPHSALAKAPKETPTPCQSACNALKKECPASCKEEGSPKEQARCLQNCPAEVKDCERNCPLMESRARATPEGQVPAEVQIPDPGSDASPSQGE